MSYLNKFLVPHMVYRDDKPGDDGGGSPNPEPKPSDQPKPDDDNKASVSALKAEKAELERKYAEAADKAAKLEAEKHAAETQKLEQEGKFKELAERESQRANDAEAAAKTVVGEMQERIKNTELKARLAIEGITDPDLYVLVDRSGIKFEGGEVLGVDEAVKAFREKKPHLFGTGATTRSANQPRPAAEPENNPKDVRRMEPKDYNSYKKDFITNLRRG